MSLEINDSTRGARANNGKLSPSPQQQYDLTSQFSATNPQAFE